MATLTMESKPAVPDLMLSQTRVIRAPRARVYEAWTNPELVMQWFGGAGRSCPGATADVRMGGGYRFEVMSPATTPGAESETQLSVAEGRYTQVVPDELLQFTWLASWIPQEETLVTISLKDAEGGTELTLVHENFQSEASRDAHAKGWAGALDNFQAVAERR